MSDSTVTRRFTSAARSNSLWRGACLATMLSASHSVSAQMEIAISQTAPSPAPRIVGQSVIGTKPASPFLYTVAATGQAPLTYMASGLPAGLTLDANSGTISGTSPAAGTYPVTLSVMNAMGSISSTLTITSGSTLALSPPMAWNSYDSFGSSVNESEALAAAAAIKTYLQPFGWNAVVVDFLWFDPEQNLDANGRYLPSPSKFPSATGNLGFKPLADKIHALGLSFGIHIMRGISRKAVTANSPLASGSFTASQAGNTNDPCPWDTHMWGVHGDTDAGKAWYDSIFAQYAQWGIDFVKVDDMVNPYSNPPDYHASETDAIRSAIDKTGRSIVLSLSPGPMQPRDIANLNTNANMWRIVNDFWDSKGLSSISDVFDAAGNWQATAGLQVGHWPDADMLPLGYVGPRCPVHASGPSALSHNQQVTVMSLWSILPSPLVFGGNPTHLSDDAWTVALLTNDEVLAVNQDAAGTHAKRIAKQGTTEVWSRELSRGRKAVALFNRGTQDATLSVSFSDLGFTQAPKVRDLWHRMDVAGMTMGLEVQVPHEGALLYTLSPPGSDGTGGTGVTGGSGGVGAGGGGGGSAQSGGGVGGVPGSSGGTKAVAGDGAAAAGGSIGLGTGGAAPTTAAAAPASSSGCACSVSSQLRGPPWWLCASALLLVFARWRRRADHPTRLTRALRSGSGSDVDVGCK